MPKVDKEFFIVQGEFYTKGAYGERGEQQFDMNKAVREQPEYVVFNGHVGALMGDNALRLKTGESVRLYLGNAGPALMSSFHIVGEIFDDVYGEGGTLVNQHNVQTTVVPVGGTAMVDLAMDVPGTYQFVDHSMFRAFNKGAMGTLQVEGPARTEIFSGRQAEEIFNPGTHLQRVAAVTPSTDHGKGVYERICTNCHQPDGRGMPGVFPPLAQSDFLMEDAERAVHVLLEGLQGPVTVNGQTFNSAMPNFSLTDDEIAAVLSYVRSNFGNAGPPVTTADVQRIRGAKDPTVSSNR
jgi:nitrite reductase (NO-forming)